MTATDPKEPVGKQGSYALLFASLVFFSVNVSIAEPWESLDTDALMAKAKGGDAEAQFRLGVAYDSGSGTNGPLNNITLSRSIILRTLYDLGLGITQDKQKAFELYSQSAGLGWAEAMWNVANMYGAGELGEIDLRNACVWTTRAFEYASPENHELLKYLFNAEAYYSGILSADELALCSREAKIWAPVTEAGDS